MNRKEILERYPNQEEKLLVAKVLEKIEKVKQRNQIEVTDFLNEFEQSYIEKLLQQVKQEEYLFWGGREEAERKMLFLFPDKLKEVLDKKKAIEKYVKVLQIEVSKQQQGEYTHKNYLGAIMKLGIKREKVGDIIVNSTGADILLQKDIFEYVENHLRELTRFQKSQIREIGWKEIRIPEVKIEIKEIIVPSLRIDCIVAELLKISRQKANEVIEQERVFLNFQLIRKNAKEVCTGDKITIRGKGRFEIKEIVRETKKDRKVVEIVKIG